MATFMKLDDPSHDARRGQPAGPALRRRAVLVALVAQVACGTAPAPRAAGVERTLRDRATARLGTLPRGAPATPLSALGRRLFFERRLSADGTVGCVTCHEPSLWGADGLARSLGVFGRVNDRNAPTVLDAATQPTQHWRGDRASVEQQAEQSLVAPASFGLGSAAEAARRIAAVPDLAAAFKAVFRGDPAAGSAKHFGDAIGAYLRTLRSPGRFDAFLVGDDRALSVDARRGLARFLELGCADCHGGPLLGGASFEKFGRFESYAALTHSQPVDLGRKDVTRDDADEYVFKVPPLRHVAETGPYFHDGSVADLSDAVRVMARTQLGQTLAPDDVSDLVAFLRSLTGDLPASFAPPPDEPAHAGARP